MTVTFARTRHTYGSYTDFWSLVELAGYTTCYVDEIDPSDATRCYVVTPLNGEWQQGWTEPKAQIIHWDLEWRLEGGYPLVPGVSAVWASDEWYAGKVGAKYVLLGSHWGLRDRAEAESGRYDVVMLAYMTWRRQRAVDQLEARGMRLAPNGWGLDRHVALIGSRTMLHVHQNDGVPTIAPQRFALAAAYGMPLVSEAVNAPGIFKDAVRWADYSELGQAVADIDTDESWRLGRALYELLCEQHSFRKCVEASL